MTILKVDHLKIYYPVKSGSLFKSRQYVKAVDDISFTVKEGQTFALVGESGSGKSSTGRAIVGLNKVTAGKIFYNGVDVTNKAKRKKNQRIQMIFQDPYSSLNPKKRVISIVTEPLKGIKGMSRQEKWAKAETMIRQLGMSTDTLNKYPFEFSGGQRQRIGIARSLIVRPKVIVADEPVSALDLSVQAQVINFMKKIQQAFHLSYVFISHDLGVVRYISDKVGIMYRGRLVELGTNDAIFTHPQHIYTKRLIASIPALSPVGRDEAEKQRMQIEKRFEHTIHSLVDSAGKPFPLKKINNHHYVSAP